LLLLANQLAHFPRGQRNAPPVDIYDDIIVAVIDKGYFTQGFPKDSACDESSHPERKGKKEEIRKEINQHDKSSL